LYSHPHHDPEFTTYTYGDPTSPKRKQLSNLSHEDLLIFYAGLQPYSYAGKPKLFVIGYFTVEKVYDFKDKTEVQRKSFFNEVPKNVHSKIYNCLKTLNVEYSDENLVIVKGNQKKQRTS